MTSEGRRGPLSSPAHVAVVQAAPVAFDLALLEHGVSSIDSTTRLTQKQFSPTADTTCVFRDSAFADDMAGTNLAAILQQQGLQNVRSL